MQILVCLPSVDSYATKTGIHKHKHVMILHILRKPFSMLKKHNLHITSHGPAVPRSGNTSRAADTSVLMSLITFIWYTWNC